MNQATSTMTATIQSALRAKPRPPSRSASNKTAIRTGMSAAYPGGAQLHLSMSVGGNRASPRSQLAAGFDTVYVNQIGPDADGFFRCYAEDVLPKVRGGQA